MKPMRYDTDSFYATMVVRTRTAQPAYVRLAGAPVVVGAGIPLCPEEGAR